MEQLKPQLFSYIKPYPAVKAIKPYPPVAS